MYVYRLETEDGAGVFSVGALNWILALADGAPRDAWPLPTVDGIDWREIEHWPRTFARFGFHDWAFARRWFAYPTLLDAAIEDCGELWLSVYDVPAKYVLRGGSQCVFHREHAKRIARLTPHTLLQLSAPL